MDETFAPDFGMGPAPAPPTLPEPTPQNHKGKLGLALMALAGALGPGAGTGVLQGYMQAEQQKRQDATRQDQVNRYRYEQEQQVYEQQARLFAQEQERKQRAYSDALSKLTTLAPQLRTRAEYDQTVNTYAGLLGSMGIRVNPQQLASAVPFLEPSERDLVAKAINENQKNYPNAWKNGAPLEGHIQFTDPKTGEVKQPRIKDVLQAGLVSLPINMETGEWIGSQGTKPAPKTRTVKTVDAKGRPVERIVEDVPGQEFPIYQEPKQGGETPLIQVTETDPDTGETVTRLVPKVAGEVSRRKPAPKPPTEGERKAASFYNQMSDAISILDELESSISGQELYQIQSLPQEDLIGAINRNQLSEAAKRYVRALEQFTEARLRPVSGAAIAQSEYERDRRTYAKQYGETPKLSRDRKQARRRALEAIKTMSGTALPPETGQEVPAPSATGNLPSYQEYLKSREGK